MKRASLILAAIAAAFVLGLAGCLALGGVNSSQYAASIQSCASINALGLSPTSVSSDASPTSPTGTSSSPTPQVLTVKGQPISDEQLSNAQTIVAVAFRNNLSSRAAEIAIMTAIQESTLINLPYGGGSSLGLFQQIEDWAPADVRMDPAQAAFMFYFGGEAGQQGLTSIFGWEFMARGDAAQSVQHSNPTGASDPGVIFTEGSKAYAQWEDEAIAIVAQVSGSTPVSSAVCDNADPLELVVRAALGMMGDPYTWKSGDGYDGAGFVREAFKAAGVDLPAAFEDQVAYVGDEAAGITVESITKDEIISGEKPLIPGDIAFFSDSDGSTLEQATSNGIYVGSSMLGHVRIATYNVLGASHTSGNFKDPESWQQRIKKVAKNIRQHQLTVVGLQELELVQRQRLMELLGSGYGISPAQAAYGNSPEVDARNSIVWDKAQVEAVEESDLDMPLYFDKNRKQIPLVKFSLVRAPEQLFYVANTHDPAKPSYAEERLQDAQQHATDADKLVAEGLPVFFTGDFNSGYALRSEGNITAGNVRENLTWCVMTASGLMVDGYDASKGRGGVRKDGSIDSCPTATSDELGVNPVDHVFVSDGIPVSGWHQIQGRAVTGSDHSIVYIDAGSDELATPTGDELGTYIGPNPETGVISRLPIRSSKLVGALRLTISTAEAPGGVLTNGSGEWVFPLPAGTYHYDPFSYGPGQSGHSFHNGTDFGTSGATPAIVAMHSGTIIRSGWGGDWGNYLVVETGVPVPRSPGQTYKYLYGHMSAYAEGLELNGSVQVGQLVGYVGNTGNSFGEHLHLTICTDLVCTSGSSVGSEGSVDPIPFLASLGIVP